MKLAYISIFFVFFVLACTSYEEQQTEFEEIKIAEQYETHGNSMVENKEILDLLWQEWSLTNDASVDDGEFTTEELIEIQNKIKNYSREYKRVENHLVEFRDFIVENNATLEKLDTPTSEVIKAINNQIVTMESERNKIITYNLYLASVFGEPEIIMQNLKILSEL